MRPFCYHPSYSRHDTNPWIALSTTAQVSGLVAEVSGLVAAVSGLLAKVSGLMAEVSGLVTRSVDGRLESVNWWPVHLTPHTSHLLRPA